MAEKGRHLLGPLHPRGAAVPALVPLRGPAHQGRGQGQGQGVHHDAQVQVGLSQP